MGTLHSPAPAPALARHHAEVRANRLGEVDLVDDEQVRLRHARPALARHLVAARHVDDVHLAG